MHGPAFGKLIADYARNKGHYQQHHHRKEKPFNVFNSDSPASIINL